MKKIYILLFFFCCSLIAAAQTIFQMQIGNGSHDFECTGVQTSDGGYAAVSTHGDSDPEICLVRLDYDGSFLWSKTFTGLGGTHEARDIKQTSDGGFIICGTLTSTTQYEMAYLIKTNASGDTMWTRTYGSGNSGGRTFGYAVQQTTDGGYIIVGNGDAFTGEYYDLMLMKITSSGTLNWVKLYGGFSDDYGYSVQQTSDGGYIAIGKTFSWGWGYTEMFIVKATSTGQLAWSGAFGSSGIEEGFEIRQTADGGYIAAGYTSGSGAGYDDCMLMKLSSAGVVQWAKTYGTTIFDKGHSVAVTNDGGYILVGYGGPDADALAVKTDLNGDTLWTRAYGNQFSSQFFNVVNTWDGGYLFSGEGGSLQGNWEDIYMVKTDASGNSGCNQWHLDLSVSNFSVLDSMVGHVLTGAGSVNDHVTVIEDPVLEDSTVCLHVGIFELQQKMNLVTSPNPFTETVKFYGTTSKGELVLFDSFGKEVLRQNTSDDQTVISASDFASGLYYYFYREDQNTAAGKIVKE